MDFCSCIHVSVLQSELLQLFPTFDVIKEHTEVLRFASGLSCNIGQLLSQHHIYPDTGGMDLWMKINILKENDVFSQDVFNTMFGENSTQLLDTQGFSFSEADLQSFFKAIKQGKLSHLKVLYFTQKTLAGCLKHLFWGPDHPGFHVLEMLNLWATHLICEDIESLSEAVKAGKLPELKELDLKGNTLTGCLKYLFGGPNHPGFPSLEKLNLYDTYLNLEDMENLNEAVRAGKLPQLSRLDLGASRVLTGCLKHLFGGPDHPGLPSLERLDLTFCPLNQEDAKSLSDATKAGKLPKLKTLDLSWPILQWQRDLRWTHLTLKDVEVLKKTTVLTMAFYLKHLFGAHDQPEFPSLERLILREALNQESVKSLSEAVRTGKLPQLKELELRDNTLSGCLKDLFGGQDHPGFPSLEELDLSETHLNREDVESLSEAVRAGKLPNLRELDLNHWLNWLGLSHNNLSGMEREVEALIAACDAHCEKRVKLDLWNTGLSEEFQQMCRDKYRNVEILESGIPMLIPS